MTKLASKYFTNLSAADLAVLRAAAGDEMTWFGDQPFDPDKINEEDDPAKPGNWNSSRRVDAQLLRWLVTDTEAGELVDQSGIWIGGAWIGGEFDLEDETVKLPIKLIQCRIDSGIDLISAKARVINLKESYAPWIWASGLSLDKDLFLSNGSYGQVVLKMHGSPVISVLKI